MRQQESQIDLTPSWQATIEEKYIVAAILILLLAVSGTYVVLTYLLPELKGLTEPSARKAMQRHQPSTAGFTIWMLLVLAICPWLIAPILGDPLPTELRVTRETVATSTVRPLSTGTPRFSSTDSPTATVTAIAASPSLPTSTPTSKPSPTPRPAVMGVALRDLKVHSCPNKEAEFATMLTIASGKQFRILGWNENNGTKWYLIEDDGIGPQQWVAGSVSVNPPNYSDYIGRTTCRVARQ